MSSGRVVSDTAVTSKFNDGETAMRFVAVDVETANPDLSSICQIGVVAFSDGVIASVWHEIVDPEDYFDPLTIVVHGITEEKVRGAPTFARVAPRLFDLLKGEVVVCHTAYDRVAVASATRKHGLPAIDCKWLDTALVVRRTWPQFSSKGYGLANVAKSLGIDFQHHVAHEDARAAGEILLRAVAETGTSVADWLARIRQPISGCDSSIARKGNLDGTVRPKQHT